MVLFVALIAFLVFFLVKIFLNLNFSKTLRYTALGTVTGIFAVFVQQFFDLSLRMSVTMAAYFMLLGLAIFLISHAYGSSTHILFKTFQVPWYAGLIFVFVAIGSAIFLFKPLFLSENHLVKAIRADTITMKERYLAQSIQYKDNPHGLMCMNIIIA